MGPQGKEEGNPILTQRVKKHFEIEAAGRYQALMTEKIVTERGRKGESPGGNSP